MGVDGRSRRSLRKLPRFRIRVDSSVNDAGLRPETLVLREQAALLIDQGRSGIYGVACGLAVTCGAVHICRSGAEAQLGDTALADRVAGHQLRNGRQMKHHGRALGQVVGDAFTRDQQETGIASYEAAALDNRRRGSKTSFGGYRKTDDNRSIQAGQCLRDRLRRLLRGFKKE